MGDDLSFFWGSTGRPMVLANRMAVVSIVLGTPQSWMRIMKDDHTIHKGNTNVSYIIPSKKFNWFK